MIHYQNREEQESQQPAGRRRQNFLVLRMTLKVRSTRGSVRFLLWRLMTSYLISSVSPVCPVLCCLVVYCVYGVQEVLIDGVWYSVSQDSPSCILVVSPSDDFGSAVCNTLGLAVGSGDQCRPRCELSKELAVGIGGIGGMVCQWFKSGVCTV